MTTTIDRRQPCAARLRLLTQEVAAAMTNHSDYSRARSPLDVAPDPLPPRRLDQLRDLLDDYGMRSIAAALADLAEQDEAAQDVACPLARSAALASRRNAGIMRSIAVTLYD